MNNIERSLRETARRSPDRIAVECRGRRLTYQELLHLLEAFALTSGSLRDRRIVLLLPDGIASYLCHLHCFQSGGIVVPLTIRAPSSKIRTLCEKVCPHFVVTNDTLCKRHASVLNDFRCITINGDNPQLQWDGLDNGQFVPAENGSKTDSQSDDLRLIVFTSGSTGEPKGVCLGESNILAAAGINKTLLLLGPLRTSLVTVPLYDYYGFIQIYSHILAGATCIFGESISWPESLFRRIRDQRVTDLVLVPHTLRELLRLSVGERQEALSSISFMTSSSDSLTPELLSKIFRVNPGLTVFNIYGLTEAGRACYRRIVRSSPPSSSIGRASPGVEIAIEGTAGEPGEIVIRGSNVMRGYLQGIDNERVLFQPCAEMRTRDLGYYDEDGEIVLIGRRDHMLNIRGSKLHPAEIELLALQVPGVEEAQARLGADSNGEPIIRLEVVPKNAHCDVDKIRARLRRHLNPLFFPGQIELVPHLTRTELGSKLIRR
jgi:long-chain acyl-CoA synthetase